MVAQAFDECSAGAVADGGGDRIGQRERLVRRVVVQIAAGGLGPKPLPHQRRFHAHLRGHVGGRQRSRSGERCPQPAAGAEGGEQHAQRRAQLGNNLAHLRLDRSHVLAGRCRGRRCLLLHRAHVATPSAHARAGPRPICSARVTASRPRDQNSRRRSSSTNQPTDQKGRDAVFLSAYHFHGDPVP